MTLKTPLELVKSDVAARCGNTSRPLTTPTCYRQEGGLAVNATQEVWRPVLGQEGRYEVSSHGRVKTVARTGTRRDGTRLPVLERIRKLTVDETGYAIISLSKPDEGTRTRFVHRVVLEAFVGPRPDGMECRHLDGDPLNNRLENLRWGTPSDNAWDRVHHGTHFHGSKTHCKRGHEFTPENTYTSPNSKRKQRDCRTCRLARQRANIKKKAA